MIHLHAVCSCIWCVSAHEIHGYLHNFVMVFKFKDIKYISSCFSKFFPHPLFYSDSRDKKEGPLKNRGGGFGEVW